MSARRPKGMAIDSGKLANVRLNLIVKVVRPCHRERAGRKSGRRAGTRHQHWRFHGVERHAIYQGDVKAPPPDPAPAGLLDPSTWSRLFFLPVSRCPCHRNQICNRPLTRHPRSPASHHAWVWMQPRQLCGLMLSTPSPAGWLLTWGTRPLLMAFLCLSSDTRS